ncbi:hypothetical protein SAMN05660971_03985 [Halomonas cupida]|uniref:Uncharacterized protein n=1 Tax=Halomonas cupida TaxID=44933 RepID=A0A1M7LWW7_9GAMM|nr:hypothetical protein SAMN05660971_03985 [Halomonas cupida]
MALVLYVQILLCADFTCIDVACAAVVAAKCSRKDARRSLPYCAGTARVCSLSACFCGIFPIFVSISAMEDVSLADVFTYKHLFSYIKLSDISYRKPPITSRLEGERRATTLLPTLTRSDQCLAETSLRDSWPRLEGRKPCRLRDGSTRPQGWRPATARLEQSLMTFRSDCHWSERLAGCEQ